jgi:hypothetical protein
MSRLLVCVILGVAVLGLPGCAATTPSHTQQVRPAGPAASGLTSEGAVPPPGRTAKRGGRVEIYGTLQRDDSGSWLVIGAMPISASSGRVIAVIVNPDSLPGVDLASMEDSYVRVRGTSAQGAATDASGLDVVADGIMVYETR